MSQARKSIWMIGPKSFIGLLGADYELMRDSGCKVVAKFYLSAFVMCVIALISFLSVRYAIELLFHERLVEIGLALFISLLFYLMYVFLINTFAKDAEDKAVNVSNITRTTFVLFMAFVLSKPIEMYFFKDQLEQEVNLVKENISNGHRKKIEQLYASDFLVLRNRIVTLQAIDSIGPEIDSIRKRISELQWKQNQLEKVSSQKIQSGSFFIYRVQSVTTKHQLSWIICIFVLFIFLIPGYVIYSVSRSDDYYKQKRERDRRMISAFYADFLKAFTSIFKDKYGLVIEYYSKYEDPPFNTNIKKEHSYRSCKDFYHKYQKSHGL